MLSEAGDQRQSSSSLFLSLWTVLKGNHHYFKLCYYV